MRIFGFNITRKSLNQVPLFQGGWRIISEPFTGAWQRNMHAEQSDLLCYPTVYACVHRIAVDIGKCPFTLKSRSPAGIWSEVDSPAYSPVLRKPNHYQTAQQFREQWVLSKLLQGNAYAILQRDARDVVTRMYLLNPYRVKPLVSESGDVFYELMGTQNLVPGYGEGNVTVPARDIIHDREISPHHPLIGVPPMCAAYWPAVKNLKLIRSEAEFFANGAAPGGILEVPGAIADEVVTEVARRWQENFTGSNAGKVAVISDGMKYQQLKASSADSQLVEQMKYSDEQICQAFGVPPYKIGLTSVPAGWKSDDVNIEYYSNALSGRIEHIENLLDEGLRISRPMGVELDTYPLWRMDEGKRAEVATTLVRGGVKTPNEGRLGFDLPPLEGGDTVYMQQQDIPLEEARKNTVQRIAPEPVADSEPEEDDTEKYMVAAYSVRARYVEKMVTL